MRNEKLRSVDGKELTIYVWDEVESPKAVLQLSHGMCENLGRYDDFARFMNKHGYIVIGDDHRGYGLTDDGKGWSEGEFVGSTVIDLLILNGQIKQKYPDLPVVFLGHSYGSILGQRFIEFNTGIKACVLTGTLALPYGVGLLGQALMWLPKLVLGKVRMAMPEANKGFEDTDVPGAWLTKDKEIRNAYVADPLAGGKASIAFMYGMIKLLAKGARPRSLKKIDKDLPIAIYCGSEDPVGMKGKLPPKLAERYKKLGIKTVDLKLYQNDRHEVLNETDRDVVYNDVLAFFDKALEK